MSDKPVQPPKDNLVRAVYPAVELRSNEDEPDGMPRLSGHFAKFNEWTEIDSLWEGRFMERIAPGAFKKTFAENRDRIRALFQHGQDPVVGDKPLGPIEDLEEDEQGARYEVPLLDTSYNRDIIPGLKAGLYGSSFRFSVVKEKLTNKPERSSYNPEGLPERTVQEARVYEFGPVTFPAYAGATAGVRSLTDVYTLQRFVREPEKLAEVLESMKSALPDGAASRHSDEGSRAAETTEQETVAPPPPQIQETRQMSDQPMSVEERVARQTEIRSRLTEIDGQYAGEALPEAVQVEFDNLNEEFDKNETVLNAVAQRSARLQQIAKQEVPAERSTRTSWEGPQVLVRKTERDIFDLSEIRKARSEEEERQMLGDNAKRAIEIASFPHTQGRADTSTDAAREHVTNLLVGDDEKGTIARHILTTGSPVYNRAFGKTLMGKPLSDVEMRALSLTGTAGGHAVPFDLDPTIIPTSNGVVNPVRQLARVVQTTVDTWRGVSSGAITATYEAEATETTDNAPTLAQPEISTEKAQAFIPFSIEIGMDWGGLRAEMGMLLQDAKDTLEASKFISGTGTNEPAGVITGTTNTVNASAGGTFTLANLYSLVAALPPRYRPRASFMGDLAILNAIRQFDTVGSSAAIWQDSLQADTPGRLLGKPAFEASEMSDVTTAGAKFLLYGDFSRYVIVDRVGLTVELIPHLMGANRRPTGQRGLYAFWRNGAEVVDANAFRALIGVA